jgi:poly(A) polymerase
MSVQPPDASSSSSGGNLKPKPTIGGGGYGVTRPLSTEGPSAVDDVLTGLLVEVLHEADFFESDEEGERREIVLGRLNKLLNQFVKDVSRRKGYPEGVLREVRGRIFTFGSYRLGVHAKDADIDTLCVLPQSVERADFFAAFPDVLRRERDVTDITPVPDAYVPVLRMVISGISIDLVMARLPVTTVSDDVNLLDVHVLRNLDEKDILSLNGSRTTDEILRLVPDVATFHTSLRAIKLWAKRRGLYNNAMGYVAGVACALLTARICQLYPRAAAGFVVHRFFHVYKQWAWPHPVILKEIEEHPPTTVAMLPMKVWNPRLHAVDRGHRMPVITPAYPSMCSTHNVSQSTLKLMTAEFERGFVVCSRLFDDAALRLKDQHDRPSEGDRNALKAGWRELLAPSDFFRRFRHFIQVLAISDAQTPTPPNSKERDATRADDDDRDQAKEEEEEGNECQGPVEQGDAEERHRLWSGFVEAKVRLLTQKLELEPGVDHAPPYHESFAVDRPQPSLEDVLLKHMYLPASASTVAIETPNREADEEEEEGDKRFHSTAFYLGIGVQKKDNAAQATASDTVKPGPRKLLLERPISDFKAFLHTWEHYGPDLLVVVRDLKREQLPTYIFPKDQRPPLARPVGQGAASARKDQAPTAMPVNDKKRPLPP